MFTVSQNEIGLHNEFIKLENVEKLVIEVLRRNGVFIQDLNLTAEKREVRDQLSDVCL